MAVLAQPINHTGSDATPGVSLNALGTATLKKDEAQKAVENALSAFRVNDLVDLPSFFIQSGLVELRKAVSVLKTEIKTENDLKPEKERKSEVGLAPDLISKIAESLGQIPCFLRTSDSREAREKVCHEILGFYRQFPEVFVKDSSLAPQILDASRRFPNENEVWYQLLSVVWDHGAKCSPEQRSLMATQLLEIAKEGAPSRAAFSLRAIHKMGNETEDQFALVSKNLAIDSTAHPSVVHASLEVFCRLAPRAQSVETIKRLLGSNDPEIAQAAFQSAKTLALTKEETIQCKKEIVALVESHLTVNKGRDMLVHDAISFLSQRHMGEELVGLLEKNKRFAPLEVAVEESLSKKNYSTEQLVQLLEKHDDLVPIANALGNSLKLDAERVSAFKQDLRQLVQGTKDPTVPFGKLVRELIARYAVAKVSREAEPEAVETESVDTERYDASFGVMHMADDPSGLD